jgi:fructan beta-fructosidase
VNGRHIGALVVAVLLLAQSAAAAAERTAAPTPTAALPPTPALPPAAAPRLYHEPYRPQYHFSAAHGWLGDPDGLIRVDRHYDLYWWGHARSVDLVHYQEEAALAMHGDAGNIGYFSGSVVVDSADTAGFGAGSRIAIYTIFDKATKNQSQGISYGSDGKGFEFYRGNPVLDIGSTEFRDPNVFWYAPEHRWIMAVALALERKIAFYGSPNLKQWTRLGEFGAAGPAEKAWECPDLVELPVDGDPAHRKWVLIVSVDWTHERYFVGAFDGREFRATAQSTAEALYVDHGLDYYASRTIRDYDDPRSATLALGWVNTWEYAQAAPSSWGRGFWSIPRELALHTTPDGLRLVQRPYAGLASLRGEVHSFDRRIPRGTHALAGFAPRTNVYEIDASFSTGRRNRVGFNLCVGAGRKLPIIYDTASHRLSIDRTGTADVDIPHFARIASARVDPVDGRVRLRLFVDTSSVEIFANDGREVFTLLTYAGALQTGIETYAQQAGTHLAMQAWNLRSIWP